MTARKQHIGSDEPATKGDLEQLREDLQADMVNNFATKDDLKQFATKEDLKQFATKDDLKQFATKEYLKRELEKVSNRFETLLNNWGKILFDKIDAAVENRTIELGAAKVEQVEMNAQRLDRYDERLKAVERQVGIPTDN